MQNKIILACLIGNTNTGKSTFFNSFTSKSYSIVNKKRNTTQNSIKGLLNIKKTQIILYDTPGLENAKTKSIIKKNIKIAFWDSIIASDVILYFIDVTKRNIQINKILINDFKKNNKKIIIILNKIDLINKNLILPIISKIKKKYGFEIIIPISSKYKIGFDFIKKNLLQFSYYGLWQNISKKNKNINNIFLSNEITRNSFLRNLNDEIPYKIKVNNTKWKIANNFNLIINQDIIINNRYYKKIILGKNGSMIKKIREYSQKQLSTIFKKKVHLYLHVILENESKR